MSNELLKQIPAVETLLQHPDLWQAIRAHGEALVKHLVRLRIAELRRHLAEASEGTMPESVRSDGAAAGELSGDGTDAEQWIISGVTSDVCRMRAPSLRRVINATGIVLNTNLGRAPLGAEVAEEVRRVVEGYSNLEIDLDTGRRSKRIRHILPQLLYLTGAEDAAVVNNNAAGVSLVVKAFADGRQVIVSRGELIEIGGSFRLPEIIDASGGLLTEVGTTNRTTIGDYERAISAETRMLLKVHRSNYSIHGFTDEAKLSAIAELAHRRGLLCVYDVGSGMLSDFPADRGEEEPSIQRSLEEGADLVTFSCDKLLGGPQAGVIAGRKELIGAIASHPLMRTYRVDKMVLAALSAVLRFHLHRQERDQRLPVYAMLSRSEDELSAAARELAGCLEQSGIHTEIMDSAAVCGGGTLPEGTFSSKAVKISDAGAGKAFAGKMHAALLHGNPPVVAILKQGGVYFDVLTLNESDIPDAAEAIIRAYEECHSGHSRTHRSRQDSARQSAHRHRL